MSLASQVNALATRVATEFKSVRTDLATKYSASNPPPAGGTPSGTKISALTAIAQASISDVDELLINDGGTSRKVTLNQLTTYFEQRGRQTNASVAAQVLPVTDTYLIGSDVLIPPPGSLSRLQAKSLYRLKIQATKTAAGVATPIINVRFGTSASLTDTARVTLTFDAQTAAIDDAVIELHCTFRAVGTTGVLHVSAMIDHKLAATGFSVMNTSIRQAASATFDTTLANARIGASVTSGASAAWTVNMVQAELTNLA